MIAASLALLAACGSQDASGESAARTADPAPEAVPSSTAPHAAATPDLSACPERELLEEGLRQRTRPIEVPSVLREVMRAGMDNFAVVTLAGATVCVDASWMEAIHDPRLSDDGRFASFDWEGYESYGHVIVDRSGAKQVIDTGLAPVFSPSGKRFAAADLGEAGFGALNAFAVWQIELAAIRRLAIEQEVPRAFDWYIERWAGDTCVELSAIPWDGYTGEGDAPRERFRAGEGGGWRIEPGRCAGA